MRNFKYWSSMHHTIRLFLKLYSLRSRIIFPPSNREKNRIYIRDNYMAYSYLFLIKNSKKIKFNYEV